MNPFVHLIPIYIIDTGETYVLHTDMQSTVIDVSLIDNPSTVKPALVRVTKEDWLKYYSYYSLIGSDALRHYVRAHTNMGRSAYQEYLSNRYIRGMQLNWPKVTWDDAES